MTATALFFLLVGSSLPLPMSAEPLELVDVTAVSPAITAAAPQGRPAPRGGRQAPSRRRPIKDAQALQSQQLPPSGGTPEPALLLLLAGGGIAYGGMRLRKKSARASKES